MTLPKTNLKEIERLLDGKPASAAYPVNLPLEILKQISRDLRATEKQGQSESPDLGAYSSDVDQSVQQRDQRVQLY